MSDFNLKVTADTKDAEVKLRQVDEAAEKSTRPRSIKIDFDAVSGGVSKVANTFNNLDTKLEDAANGIRKFYSVAEKVPVLGKPLAEFHELIDTTKQAAQGVGQFGQAVRENGGAATILSGSMRVSVTAAQDLVSRLARLGMALFAVKEAASMLQAAFGGMFAATVGREVAFRETVLKMQTTLASSQAQISVDGQKIVDPYQRVLAVQGAIEARIKSIRDRSQDIAGVTSEQIVDAFGIIVSQAGQIGISLKQAEDLAISFAGALGTFGIPLEMARQEIQSIFTGNITSDSYLAKALNITNEDIAKAKNQIGGVYGFLQEKLAAAVAGQKIASGAFSGLTSNIKEIREAIEKAFGATLLDPILEALTTVFEFLKVVQKELVGLATAVGSTMASLVSFNIKELLGGSMGSSGDVTNFTEGVRAGIIQLTNAVGTIGQAVQSAITPVLGQIRTLIDAVGASMASILPGLLALARGFLSLQAANITALIGAFSTLSPLIVQLTQVFSGLLATYGEILRLPMVQYLSGIIVQWQVLGKTGIWAVMGIASLASFLIGSWSGVIAFFAKLAVSIAAAFSRGATFVARFVTSSAALIQGLTQAVNGFVEAFVAGSTVIQGAGARIQGSISGITSTLQGVGAKATTGGAANSIFTGLKTGATEVVNVARNVGASLTSVQAKAAVSGTAANIFTGLQSGAAAAAPTISRIGASLTDLGTRATAATSNIAPALSSAFTQGSAVATNAVRTVGNSLSELKTKIAPSVASSNLFTALKTGAADAAPVIAQVGTAVSGLGSRVATAAPEIGKSLFTAFDTTSASALRSINTIGTGIADLKSRVDSSGIANNLFTGLKTGATQATTTIQGLRSQAVALRGQLQAAPAANSLFTALGGQATQARGAVTGVTTSLTKVVSQANVGAASSSVLSSLGTQATAAKSKVTQLSTSLTSIKLPETSAAPLTALSTGATQAATAGRELKVQADAMANSLKGAGTGAVEAATSMEGLKTSVLGGIWSFIKANLAMLALQLAIVAAIDAWGKYSQTQKDIAANTEARSILSQYGKALFDTSTEIDKATQRQRDFNKSIVEGEYTAAKKRLKEYENEVKQFQKDRAYADALGGWGGIEQAGLAIRAAELAKRMPGIQRDREMVKFYEDLQKAADAHAKKEADVAANATKTVEQIQKQVDLRKQLVEIGKQEAHNATNAELLSADITKEQAKLKILQDDRDYAKQSIGDKQDELKVKTDSGRYHQKDLDAIKKEIADLQGTVIQLSLDINTTKFEIDMKPIRYAFADAAKQLDAQATVQQANLTIAQARANAETTVNNALIQGLQTDLQRATSSQERLAIAGRIRELEINNATIALNTTKQQIALSIELARIELAKQQLAAQGLIVEIQKAAFHKQDATELERALVAQKQSVKMAEGSLNVARQVGAENGRAADATYNASVRAANLNYATNSAAKAAGQFASNMQEGAQAATQAASSVANTAAALDNMKGSTWRAPGLEGGDVLDQQRLNQALRDLDARAVRERMSGKEYDAAKGQIIAWIQSQNKQKYENSVQDAIDNRISTARGLIEKIAEARSMGDLAEVGKLQSRLQQTGYAQQAQSKIDAEQYAQRRQADKEVRALGRYETDFFPKRDKDSGPGTVNITTGPVYKWQDKEFVSMSDLQKAIKDAQDQVYAKLRGSSGFRQDLGMAY